jgi:hypothetical protein
MKAYDGLSKDALAATIEEAHALKVPVTAHLGVTVSCREAAELGIDNLEHGFGPCTGKTSDGLGNDPEGPRARALVQLGPRERVLTLDDRGVYGPVASVDAHDLSERGDLRHRL